MLMRFIQRLTNVYARIAETATVMRLDDDLTCYVCLFHSGQFIFVATTLIDACGNRFDISLCGSGMNSNYEIQSKRLQ